MLIGLGRGRKGPAVLGTEPAVELVGSTRLKVLADYFLEGGEGQGLKVELPVQY